MNPIGYETWTPLQKSNWINAQALSTNTAQGLTPTAPFSNTTLGIDGVNSLSPDSVTQMNAMRDTDIAGMISANDPTTNVVGKYGFKPSVGDGSETGLGDFTSKDFGNYASGIGAVGQLGLGVLGYLDNKKTAESQRNLLNQQYTTNNELMGNYRKDRQHTVDAFKAK